MTALTWYTGRAAAMSPREVGWRVQRAATALASRDGLVDRPDSSILADGESDWPALVKRFRTGAGRPVLLDRERAREVADRHPAQVRALITEADRILAGERRYFGYRSVDVGADIDWNRDPISGHRWPAVAAARIDHRTASGDPKWIWELNRLQHLPVLAQAWLFTGESRYAETAFVQLDSWLEQNPIGTGIAWRGAFEAGVRAISVAIALQGLRTSPALNTQRYRRIVRMLDATARYCWRARSRFSSANNHLIGELSGLATVALLFPELAAPATLSGRANATLAAEAGRLILPDGAGAEQSISYQIFATELLAVPLLLMRLRGDRPPGELAAALDRGADYLVALVGSEDPDPRYGDDDDSFALRLGAERKRTVRQHLGIVAALTGNGAAARYGEDTLTAAWIAAALGTPIGVPGAHPGVHVDAGHTRPSAYAPDGGLVVLRGDRRRVTMDVGPLGYLSIAAHGHADALAVTISDEGHELIVDPGTGSFYGDPAVRAVHRGTRVHPTVCVDAADQSVPGGPFYWRRHARTTVHAVDLRHGVVDAEHDGYRRLPDPVVHRRWLIARPADPTVLVVDLIDGRGAHDVAVSWPLHPSLDATAVPAGHLITRDRRPVLGLYYAGTARVDTEQVRAEGLSQLGWWSARLESRIPAWLVAARCRAVAPVAILTLVRVGDPGTVTGPDLVRHGVLLTARWSEHGVQRELSIDTSRPGAVLGISTPSVTGLGRRS